MIAARPITLILCAAACVTTLSGCKPPPNEYKPPPPPEVTVAQPVSRTVPETLEFTGTTRGYEEVQLRARVRGFLVRKHVVDGRRVAAGELLFTIDPRPFQATVKQADAELAARQADLRLAQIQVDRTDDMFRKGAAGQFELDRVTAERDSAKANADLAAARLETAKLDLSFTEVRAPINGRIGIIPVSEGDLVGATDATLLTTLINDDIIFAAYDIDEPTVLKLRAANANRRPGEEGRPELPVRLALANESGFPHEGQFHRADNTINRETGTVRIEAIFDNPTGTILPGSFVRIQSLFGQKTAMLVPDTAVMTDQIGRYVLVADEAGSVERRNVRVGGVFERMRVVEEGLDEKAWVIVNGIQRARPGGKVAVKKVPPVAAPAASAPPASAATSSPTATATGP